MLIPTLFRCSKKRKSSNNEITEIEKNIKNQTFNTGIITGKTDDLDAFKYFNAYDNSNLSYNIKNYFHDKYLTGDSLVLLIDSISTPRLIDIYATSNKAVYDAQILLRPNDTAVFEIKNRAIRFLGKNSDENNFYTELNNSTPNYTENAYRGDIIEYKRKTDSIYDEKKRFFNNYKKVKKLSPEFEHLVYQELKYHHLSELVSVRIPKNNFNIGKPDALITIVQKEYSSKEFFFNFNDYFENITLDDFQDENLINLNFFQSSLIPLIRNYFEDSEYPLYSQEKFLAEKEFIENNFDGKIKEYLLGMLAFNYNRKGLGGSERGNSLLVNYILEYEVKYPNTPFKEDFKELKDDLSNFYGNILTDLALDTKLVDKFGDTLTLREIFGRSSKRIKIIDFWASWCGPCINEIIKAKSFRDKLSVENNVEWIYLSIDAKMDDWLRKSEDLNDFLNVRNQYYILGGQKSQLSKYLKVDWIPKYVIINKKNEVILNNAPRPSDSIVFYNIIRGIYKKIE
jgi:thiol-disulfide isomerase/thioredoxin